MAQDLEVLVKVVEVLELVRTMGPSCCCRRRKLYFCFHNLPLSHSAHICLRERLTSTKDHQQLLPPQRWPPKRITGPSVN